MKLISEWAAVSQHEWQISQGQHGALHAAAQVAVVVLRNHASTLKTTQTCGMLMQLWWQSC